MASALGLDFSKNLSLYTIPAAFVLAQGPHLAAVISAGKAYDNTDPRGFSSNIASSQAMTKAKKHRLTALHNASTNAYETLGFFAAAVVAANQARLEPTLLNSLSFGYLATRIAFIFAYTELTPDATLSWFRSVSWFAGTALSSALYIKAGINISKTYVF
ncbi:hypothetical protein N3K66_001192 [Trichothecium roseum]|uniref:Uncharacterized protein n=1 Tax=Trichothecium roseum TaxID=47278 RepID=A0ACC0VEX3_9HYPO|nr:hypothetical protein N3K66_001192 [Trichothecium roseum]